METRARTAGQERGRGSGGGAHEDLRPGCSCAALRKAARHVSRLYDEALAPAALGVNQFSVLATLGHSGPASLGGLARLMVMDRSTLGHLLRPLQRRGLVKIALGADDRRQRLLSLTASGTALLAEARPRWRRAEEAFQRTFGAAHTAALRELLGIAARLEIDVGESPIGARRAQKGARATESRRRGEMK